MRVFAKKLRYNAFFRKDTIARAARFAPRRKFRLRAVSREHSAALSGTRSTRRTRPGRGGRRLERILCGETPDSAQNRLQARWGSLRPGSRRSAAGKAPRTRSKTRSKRNDPTYPAVFTRRSPLRPPRFPKAPPQGSRSGNGRRRFGGIKWGFQTAKTAKLSFNDALLPYSI